MKKQFDACIYLYQGSAVKTLTDHTIVSNDPAALAAYYCNNNADRIIVFDQSNNDEEHEAALDTNRLLFIYRVKKHIPFTKKFFSSTSVKYRP